MMKTWFSVLPVLFSPSVFLNDVWLGVGGWVATFLEGAHVNSVLSLLCVCLSFWSFPYFGFLGWDCVSDSPSSWSLLTFYFLYITSISNLKNRLAFIRT